jgi:hypothetical protein
MLYLGNNKIIHALGANGVKYDSLIILRIPKDVGRSKRIIRETIKYAKSQFKNRE